MLCREGGGAGGHHVQLPFSMGEKGQMLFVKELGSSGEYILEVFGRSLSTMGLFHFRDGHEPQVGGFSGFGSTPTQEVGEGHAPCLPITCVGAQLNSAKPLNNGSCPSLIN